MSYFRFSNINYDSFTFNATEDKISLSFYFESHYGELNDDILNTLADNCVQLNCLTIISIERVQFNIHTFNRLFKSCLNLKKVDFHFPLDVTNEQVLTLSPAMKNLTHIRLNFENNNESSGILVSIFKSNPQITHFDYDSWFEGERNEVIAYLHNVGRVVEQWDV